MGGLIVAKEAINLEGNRYSDIRLFTDMTQKHKIQLFEEKKVRTVWDDQEEKWYFSVVDVCAVLSESENPQTYWRVLKNRLKKEGNETVTNCNALKLRAADGKMRLNLL